MNIGFEIKNKLSTKLENKWFESSPQFWMNARFLTKSSPDKQAPEDQNCRNIGKTKMHKKKRIQ